MASRDGAIQHDGRFMFFIVGETPFLITLGVKHAGTTTKQRQDTAFKVRVTQYNMVKQNDTIYTCVFNMSSFDYFR